MKKIKRLFGIVLFLLVIVFYCIGFVFVFIWSGIDKANDFMDVHCVNAIEKLESL